MRHEWYGTPSLELTCQRVPENKELKMTYEYIEVPGGDHINVAFQNLPRIFEFFEKHAKQ